MPDDAVEITPVFYANVFVSNEAWVSVSITPKNDPSAEYECNYYGDTYYIPLNDTILIDLGSDGSSYQVKVRFPDETESQLTAMEGEVNKYIYTVTQGGITIISLKTHRKQRF